MTDWQEHGDCRAWPTETFFPEKGNQAGFRLAKSICADCPVQPECAEYSLQEAQRVELWGVWGGLTQQARHKELKRRGLRPARAAWYDTNRPTNDQIAC